MFRLFRRPRPDLPTFRLEIEPFAPYRARLHIPGGGVKLLSEHEAYQMLCERALRRWAHGKPP